MDFVKDFIHNYLTRVDMQENKKKVYYVNIYALD